MIEQAVTSRAKPASQFKFIIGGVLIVAAIVYLIVSSTQANTQYFVTVDELLAKGQSMVGKDIRLSGAVIGDSITVDAENMTISFTIAQVPGDNAEIEAKGGLAAVLKAATTDPTLNHIQVVYHGVKPDLLRNEAQAIMTGQLGDDGIFYADELMLKCPTKYEDSIPDQSNE